MAIIQNLYESKEVKKFTKKLNNPTEHETGIPYHSRTLICGASGTGKTHTLLNYIMNSPDTFGRIIVVSLGIEEPIYQSLAEQLGPAILFRTPETMPTLQQYQEDVDSMTKPNESAPQTLLIWDDLVGNNDRCTIQKIRQYMLAGRKCHLTQMFITQSFFKTDIVCRAQMSHLILLKLQDTADLRRILSKFNLGVSLEHLHEMYFSATKNKFSSLKIDIQTAKLNKRFSKDFVEWFQISDKEEDD